MCNNSFKDWNVGGWYIDPFFGEYDEYIPPKPEKDPNVFIDKVKEEFANNWCFKLYWAAVSLTETEDDLHYIKSVPKDQSSSTLFELDQEMLGLLANFDQVVNNFVNVITSIVTTSIELESKGTIEQIKTDLSRWRITNFALGTVGLVKATVLFPIWTVPKYGLGAIGSGMSSGASSMLQIGKFKQILEFVGRSNLFNLLGQYFDLVNNKLRTDPYNRLRTVRLNTTGVDTLEFDMPDLKKCKMIYEGYQKTIKFLTNILLIQDVTNTDMTSIVSHGNYLPTALTQDRLRQTTESVILAFFIDTNGKKYKVAYDDNMKAYIMVNKIRRDLTEEEKAKIKTEVTNKLVYVAPTKKSSRMVDALIGGSENSD